MIRLALCFLMVFASTTFGQQDQSAINPKVSYLDGLAPTSFSLTQSYRTKSVFSNGFVGSEDPVLNTDLFLVTKCGLTLDVWASMPADLSEIGEDFATELDITLGWQGKVGDYNLSASIAYDDLYRTLTPEGSDLIVLATEISRDFKFKLRKEGDLMLSPFARVEVNFTPDGTIHGDALPRVGAKYAWQVNDLLTVAGKAMVVYDPGIAGGDVAWVANVEGSLLWKLGKHAVLEAPFIKYVDPINSLSDGRKGELVGGVGITFPF